MMGKVKALAAGFLVGLLVAPRSGRDSRRMVMEWVNDFLDGGTRRFRDLEDELARRRATDGEDWLEEEILSDDEPLP